MAQLPTLTVTDAQLARIQNVFTDPSGTVTPQQAYKQWLIAQLVAYVKQIEMQQHDADLAAQRAGYEEQINADFDGIT